MSPWSVFSLRTLAGKLIVASVLLVIGALVLASGIFVALTHGQEKQRALDHTVATAPIIHGEFLQRLLDGDSLTQLQDYVRGAAGDHDVRILVFDYSGQVVEDTGGSLSGTQLNIAENPQPPGPQHDSYHTFQLQGVAGEDSIVLVAPFPELISRGQRISIPPPNGGTNSGEAAGTVQELVPPYRLAIVVPEDTIAHAWLNLLPWLALAAVIALPAAVGSAIIISRNITRPLSQLTAAADQMSQGAFDIDVSTDRADEVGQLSRSFSSMAQNVGETHSQMRALLANVSHDMRTPLTSILGFAQALRGGVITGEAESKHAGDVIYDEVAKLSERLDNLLFLSEIEAGQALVQCEDVDLSALVSTAVERTAAGAEERSVRVTCDLTPDMHASLDSAKLERALENLLENARKFTPNGGDIYVRAFRVGDGQACVEVANTATDIDASELPKLFERFYRRDRARTGRSAGSGLGLPIARDLVELHGGTLEAQVADGTVTFRMTLPPSPAPSA